MLQCQKCWVFFFSEDCFYTDLGSLNQIPTMTQKEFAFFLNSLHFNQLGVLITPRRLGHWSDIKPEISLIAVTSPTETVV